MARTPMRSLQCNETGSAPQPFAIHSWLNMHRRAGTCRRPPARSKLKCCTA